MEGIDLDAITLPPNFAISIYTAGVENARSLALGANGILFVGSRSAGSVYAVLDHDQDARPDATIVIAASLNMPNGVTFRDGSLYVAAVNRVLRYDNIESRLKNPPAPASYIE